jgi:hemerythrin
MAFIVWNDALKIGIDEIDTQHMKFAGVINSLYDANTARERARAVEKALLTLVSYVKYHFKTEEDLMSLHGYPDAADHIVEHVRLTSEVNRLEEKMSGCFYGLDYGDFMKFVRDWFMNHTQGTDRKVIPHFSSVGAMDAQTGAAPDRQKSHIEIIPLIVWDDKFNLGIDTVDEHHRTLVELINAIYTSIEHPGNPAFAEKALLDLHKYTDYHFDYEEQLMKEMNYPLYEDHVITHRQFRRQITDLKNQFARHQSVVDFDLVMLLKDWFMRHSQDEDREYVSFLNP